MQRHCRIYLVITVLLINWQGEAKAEQKPEPDMLPGWLAFGDLRGNIEPCGCDPSSDLGGLRRIATIIHQERSLNSSIGVFDLGNNFAGKTAVTKNLFIRKGLDKIEPTASLVNFFDLKPLHSFSQRNVVLTNLRNYEKNRGIKTFIRQGQWLVFGYTWHEKIKMDTQRWNPELEKKIRNIKKTQKDFMAILLFSGPLKDLKKAAMTNLFDTIISSNERKLKDKSPDLIEKERPNLLIRHATHSSLGWFH